MKRRFRSPNPPEFRLARILWERWNAEGRSYARLARNISLANGIRVSKTETGIIDRRKLTKLIEQKEFSLDLIELQALDRYLDQFNEGLAHKPIFERKQILQRLVDAGNVTFLLASRARDTRVDLSHWDVDSLAEIQRSVNRISSSCRFDQHNVLLRTTLQEAKRALNKPWLKEMLGDSGPSLVCIGAPRACHAAEAMLAKMFHVEPFAHARNDADLPFHFVWRREPQYVFRSCVARFGEDLRGFDRAATDEVVRGHAWAVQIGNQVYRAKFPGNKPTKAYGIVAVQRRSSGQVWMVVAGLSGVGTYAASLAVPSIADTLPEKIDIGEESKVLWTAIEANVVLDKRRKSARLPRIVSWRILTGPNQWEPSAAGRVDSAA